MPVIANVVAFTHQGAVRSHNEDSLGVSAWVRSEPMAEPRQTRVDLSKPFALLVCDGMGGHEAGEVASGIAVRELSVGLSGPSDFDGITSALRKTNQLVFDAAALSGGRRGMGTTVAGIWLSAERLIWFNVGDSRVYRVRDGFLRQLSIDDVSGAQDASRSSHAITQSLGGLSSFTEIDPHLDEEPIVPGWRYLICSDGLTDMLNLQEIQTSISEDPIESVQSLFSRTMAAGGADNITIILVTVEDCPDTGSDHA